MKKTSLIFSLALMAMLAVSVPALAASSLEGDAVEYDFRSGQAIATGNIVLTRDDGKATAKKAEYNTKTENGKLEGSVVANQKDAHLTCHTLFFAQGGDHLTAVGNAVLKKEDKTLRAAQVEYYGQRQYAETVGSWAQMGMDDGSTMDATSMNYDMGQGLAHAEGNVRISSPPRKLTAKADRAVYNTKLEDGTIDLIGNATATQDGNTVSGNTLTLKGAGGKVAVAKGDVRLVYIPKEDATKGQGTIVNISSGDGYQGTRVRNWPGESVAVGQTAIA